MIDFQALADASAGLNCARCSKQAQEFIAEGIATGEISGNPPEPCDRCKQFAAAILELHRPAFPWWAQARKLIDLAGSPGELWWAVMAFCFGVGLGNDGLPAGFVAGVRAVGGTMGLIWAALTVSKGVEAVARRRRMRRLAAKLGSSK